MREPRKGASVGYGRVPERGSTSAKVVTLVFPSYGLALVTRGSGNLAK
jgi:hypothetical protein